MTTPRVTVPVEPTEAMMKAADAVDWNNEDERASVVNMWQAMLSAAPAPEGGAVDEWRPIDSAPQDGAKIDLWGHWPEHDRWTRTPDAVWDEERCDWKVNGFYAGQYAHPPRFTHWRAISGPAALATREEAPAEAVEDDDDASIYRPSVAGLSDYLWNQALAAESVESRCILEMWREAVDSSAQTGQSAMTLDRLCHVEDWAQAPSALRAQPPAREDAQPVPFIVGNQYRTQSGDLVRFVSVHRAGTPYETMSDEDGVHRYTMRDYGRVTGTDHGYSDPRNTPPLYTHPAPDALRNALADLIENAVAARGCGLKNDPAGIVSSALFDTIMNGRAALATLQAEQGAK